MTDLPIVSGTRGVPLSSPMASRSGAAGKKRKRTRRCQDGISLICPFGGATNVGSEVFGAAHSVFLVEINTIDTNERARGKTHSVLRISHLENDF